MTAPNPSRQHRDRDDSIDPWTALDNAPVLIWFSGPDKSGVLFNKTWTDFTGRSLEEELGDGWLSAVHPDDFPNLEACGEAFEQRVPFRTEFRLRRRDGVWRWMLDTGVPRFTPEGKFAGFIGSCIDITDQKDAEAALRVSEERLQLAQEAASIGTYDWDIQGGSITWSPAMFRLHGIDPATPQENIYPAWLERLHPEDRERADRETREFVEKADALSIEFRIVHPENGYRWIHGRGRMIRNEEGSPIRMIGVNFDVTEQRQAEHALRESEQRLRDIAENFPGIIFRRITYPDGRVEYPYFSGPDDAVFHIPRERIDEVTTIDDVLKHIHHEDVEEMLAKFREAAANLSPLDVEGRLVREDDEVLWVRSLSRPHLRGDGALVWDGVMLDVTEQHRREGERERAAAMLRMGMELARIGTWEFDPVTETVTASSVANSIFNLPTESGPRPLGDYLKSVHPDDLLHVRNGLTEAAAQKGHMSREYRVVAPDGEVRWIGSRGSFVRLADGTERMIGALFDITERKRREDEREKSLERQRMLLRELNHRIKNNLQMITGMLRLQASRLESGPAGTALDRAMERVQAISDLHGQLKFEGGLGRIDFSTYLQQLCEKLQTSVLAGAAIELRCEVEPCMLDLDRAVPLGLIVNELVTNAIKYAFPDGAGGTILVKLSCLSDGGLAVLIRDSGKGIASDVPTSGLGTRLVQGLCAQIGATIATNNGSGTVHEITVPSQEVRALGNPGPR